MARLITFSGTVGTGKTHSSKWVRDVLVDAGYNVYYLRYRFVSFRMLFKEKKIEKTHNHAMKVKKKKIGSRTRFREFIPARLSILYYLGYLYRAIRLHILLALKYDVVVLDRYVYDSLTQYDLEDKSDIKRAKKLAGWFPAPECSFVMDAGIETLLKRRKFHSEHYLIHVLENYRMLAENIDNVCVIPTDELESVNGKLMDKLKLKFSLDGVKEV